MSTLTAAIPNDSITLACQNITGAASNLCTITPGSGSGVTFTNGTGINITGNSTDATIGITNLEACNSVTEYSVWNGSHWLCDNDGSNTYTAGTGLQESGNVFSLNTTYTDTRYWNADGDTTPTGNYRVTYNGSSNAFQIINNGSGTSNIGLDVLQYNADDTAVGVRGNTTGRSVLKVSHEQPGASDTNAAALGLFLIGATTDAQGLFMDVGNSTGNWIHVTDNVNSYFILEQASGGANAIITSNSSNALLVQNTAGTDRFRIDSNAGLGYLGVVLRPNSPNTQGIGQVTVPFSTSYITNMNSTNINATDIRSNNIAINGSQVCTADGNNCPAGSADGNNYTTSISIEGNVLTLVRNGMASNLLAYLLNNSIILDYANITNVPGFGYSNLSNVPVNNITDFNVKQNYPSTIQLNTTSTTYTASIGNQSINLDAANITSGQLVDARISSADKWNHAGSSNLTSVTVNNITDFGLRTTNGNMIVLNTTAGNYEAGIGNNSITLDYANITNVPGFGFSNLTSVAVVNMTQLNYSNNTGSAQFNLSFTNGTIFSASIDTTGTGGLSGGIDKFPAIWTGANTLTALLINQSHINTTNAGTDGQVLTKNSTGGMYWTTPTSGSSYNTTYNVTFTQYGFTYMENATQIGTNSLMRKQNATTVLVNKTLNTTEIIQNGYYSPYAFQTQFTKCWESEFGAGSTAGASSSNAMWGLQTISSGALVNTASGGDDHPLITSLQDSTTANGGVMVLLSGVTAGAFTPKTRDEVRAIVRFSSGKAGVVTGRIGFSDTQSITAPTDGCYLEMNATATNVAQFTCSAAGTRTPNATTYAFANATWYGVQIRYLNTTAANATIYSDTGTVLLDVGLSSGINTAASNPQLIVTQSTTDAAATILDLDYIGFCREYKPQRAWSYGQ
jgi:hypothetical protein